MMELSALLLAILAFNAPIAWLQAATNISAANATTNPYKDDVELVPVAPEQQQQQQQQQQPPPAEQPSARIVGGQNAADAQFPYQVSLRVRGSHICGGAIISRSYVLTAAHCVVSGSRGRVRSLPASLLSVRAGTVNVNAGGVVANVAQVISHPNYRNFNNDIALLRLSAPLTFSNAIAAATLASAELPNGASVIISGWGRLRTGGSSPVRLQYNTLRAVSNAQCRRQIGNAPDSLLCLGHSNGNGACQGDSGGPGAYNGTLVGITNFVINGCGSSQPDGYAKVSFFRSWIRQNSDLQ